MKILKYITWVVAFGALFILWRIQGVQNGSGYIQYVDGCILAFSAGVAVESLPRLKRYIERHKQMHQDVQSLHEHVRMMHMRNEELHTKTDELHKKLHDAGVFHNGDRNRSQD